MDNYCDRDFWTVWLLIGSNLVYSSSVCVPDYTTGSMRNIEVPCTRNDSVGRCALLASRDSLSEVHVYLLKTSLRWTGPWFVLLAVLQAMAWHGGM